MLEIRSYRNKSPINLKEAFCREQTSMYTLNSSATAILPFPHDFVVVLVVFLSFEFIFVTCLCLFVLSFLGEEAIHEG